MAKIGNNIDIPLGKKLIIEPIDNNGKCDCENCDIKPNSSLCWALNCNGEEGRDITIIFKVDIQ